MLAATKFAEWAPTTSASPCSSTSTTTRCGPRSTSPRARAAPLGRAARHVGPARRPGALGRDGRLRPDGVNERLVRKVRVALDEDGFERVRIVASGGFTVEKIEAFERGGVPGNNSIGQLQRIFERLDAERDLALLRRVDQCRRDLHQRTHLGRAKCKRADGDAATAEHEIVGTESGELDFASWIANRFSTGSGSGHSDPRSRRRARAARPRPPKVRCGGGDRSSALRPRRMQRGRTRRPARQRARGERPRAFSP